VYNIPRQRNEYVTNRKSQFSRKPKILNTPGLTYAFAGLRAPELRRFVLAGGQNQLAAWANRHVNHAFVVWKDRFERVKFVAPGVQVFPNDLPHCSFLGRGKRKCSGHPEHPVGDAALVTLGEPTIESQGLDHQLEQGSFNGKPKAVFPPSFDETAACGLPLNEFVRRLSSHVQGKLVREPLAAETNDRHKRTSPSSATILETRFGDLS